MWQHSVQNLTDFVSVRVPLPEPYRGGFAFLGNRFVANARTVMVILPSGTPVKLHLPLSFVDIVNRVTNGKFGTFDNPPLTSGETNFLQSVLRTLIESADGEAYLVGTYRPPIQL